jgi:hypothetical protein
VPLIAEKRANLQRPSLSDRQLRDKTTQLQAQWNTLATLPPIAKCSNSMTTGLEYIAISKLRIDLSHVFVLHKQTA